MVRRFLEQQQQQRQAPQENQGRQEEEGPPVYRTLAQGSAHSDTGGLTMTPRGLAARWRGGEGGRRGGA